MLSKETISMSGFPPGYENVCQKLLWNGIAIIERDPAFAETALKQMRSFKNVFGIINTDGAEAKRFEEEMMKGCSDMTGAMVHQVILNLIYIAQNGKEKWLDTIRAEQPDRIFVWDGTEASCPKVDEEKFKLPTEGPNG